MVSVARRWRHVRTIPIAFHAQLGRWVAADRAQGVVEYGLLIATIAVVVLLGVTSFGQQIEPWFAQLAGRITTTGT
jgi:Flp pilus assembly pilin Flp